MSKKTDHAGADAADDISSLFAKLGSQGASAYQDFSGARLSAPEPATVEPPAAVPLPPAVPVPAPALSVVRAPAEPRLAVAAPAPRAGAAEPARAPAPAPASTATPLARLFQRLLDSDRARAPAPDSPLKRFQNR
ncbi:hypothetical protein [Xanthomonas tesorieronis]|uniref:hypothetical protein n=1 Tax=Xanthomonas tesorieronis TaxID=3160839 RepID=UPI00351792E8